MKCPLRTSLAPARFGFVVVLCASLAGSSCGKSEPAKSKESASDPAAKSEPVADKASRALDPSFVPIAALEELADIPLESAPPCSLTLESLRPALESIASFRVQLASAIDEASAVKILTELATDLTGRIPSIAARSETDELRRISAELSASVGDLAESLKLASDALTAHDKQAAATTMRRIHNGVANTRSSVEGLIGECAP